jgi:hypothetical protein
MWRADLLQLDDWRFADGLEDIGHSAAHHAVPSTTAATETAMSCDTGGRAGVASIVAAAPAGGLRRRGPRLLGTAGQPVFRRLRLAHPRDHRAGRRRRTEHKLLCDSGSQLTFLDASSFRRSRRQAPPRSSPSPSPSRLSGASFDAFGDDDTLAGIIAATSCALFAFTMDYAGGRVWLSESYDPSAQAVARRRRDPPDHGRARRRAGQRLHPAAAATRLADRSGCPATPRILVRATFEDVGQPVWVMVDSGASTVVMSDALESVLALDEVRPHLSGVRFVTPAGRAAGGH